ncbi:ATP-binding protein [Haloterrigena sp. SYSU A121-1]|uniref:ATP-binding protein n=1 Tax=Haloterrigena gelatinilytica TaxID=2741724 RepID=A0A8J8GJF2_9EURY|nr:DUF87 domain-containing protein [Haloterrigena gelatinilytica]NUB91099.1 ATP-binding protein [Haloterrigena gelatinilytica]
MAAASPNDTVREQVHRVLQVAASDHAQYPFDVPKLRNVATVPGDSLYELDLGRILNSAAAFTLSENVLTRHVLVSGETGSGKTTLFYSIVDQCPAPVWMFDLKTDYRHLLRESPDLVVLPWNQLKLNPLRPPPGETPRRWAQAFQELFGDAYDLLGGSQNYLLPHLLELYEDHDIAVEQPVDSDTTGLPTLQELSKYLAEDGRKGLSQSKYKDTTISKLRAMTAATGDLFDCRRGHPLPDLLKQDIVFEFDGLATDHQDFLMEWLLTWVYTYRNAQQQRGDRLRHVFLCDEGKRLFSAYKERSDAKGLPQIDDLTDKMREFGEALVVGDQEPQKLTDSLLANTGTKVLFPIGDADQYRRVARSMELTERQRRYGNNLDVGQAVAQVGGNDPVPVQFHYYELEKTVTDTELQDCMQETWTQLASSTGSETVTSETSKTGSSGEEAASSVEPAELALSDDAEELLRDIAENPFKSHSERYGIFSETSPHRGVTAKEELDDHCLIREHTTVDESGERKLLEPTDAGKAYLAELDVEVSHRGRGGVVHRYWQDRICTLFQENGYEAAKEQDDTDMAVHVNGGRIAVEVAMRDRQREIDHARDRLQDGFDGVIIACRNPNVRRGLEDRLQNTDLPKQHVQFRLFRDFFSLDTLISG